MSVDYSHNNNAVNDAIRSSYQKKLGDEKPEVGAGYQLSASITYQVPKTWTLKDRKTEARVCYVIATWSGNRRAGNTLYHKKPTIYLEKHIEQLKKLDHSLDLIVVAVPDNQEEPIKYTSYIENLPNKIGSTPLTVIKRENIGQSYGSYSDAFEQFPDYNYYIFIEDDYAPVVDNFDEILIQMFKASPDCGYLCSYAHNRPPSGPHAAISNGISSKEILSKIKEKLGCLPYAGNITKTNKYAADAQLEFSRGFFKIHTRIYDYLSFYNAPFNEAGTFMMYGEPQLPTLIYPIQFL